MVMSMVAEGQAKAAGIDVDRAALKKQEERLTGIFNSQAGAFYCSGHMTDDGMIDPRQTRRTLGFLLATVWEARARTVRPNSFGVGRM
jgi:geranyl-CoA carboxylase beta subunit